MMRGEQKHAALEREVSFRIKTEANLESVLDVLWPMGGLIDAGSVCFELEGECLETSLHLYAVGTTMSQRQRVKFKKRSGVLQATFDTKEFVDEDKYETPIDRTTKFAKISAMLKAFGFIGAALVKQRLSLDYVFGVYNRGVFERGRCVVGVDRLICFDPLHLQSHSEPHYHMEIEGDRLNGHMLLRASELFKASVEAQVHELDDENTKWRLAVPYCRKDFSVASLTMSELSEYYDAAANLLSR